MLSNFGSIPRFTFKDFGVPRILITFCKGIPILRFFPMTMPSKPSFALGFESFLIFFWFPSSFFGFFGKDFSDVRASFFFSKSFFKVFGSKDFSLITTTSVPILPAFCCEKSGQYCDNNPKETKTTKRRILRVVMSCFL